MRLLRLYSNSLTEVRRVRDLCARAASEHVERSAITPRDAPTRLTATQNAQIVELYKAGFRPVDIAREVGTTEWTVHHRLNRNGVTRRPAGMTTSEIQEALRLNDEGVPITELTKRFEKSWKTIAKELRNARETSN